MTLIDQEQAQNFNEGGFTHAGHAAHAQAKRLVGVREQGSEQLVSLRAVVCAGGFEQGDGFGDGAALGLCIQAHDGLHQR